MENKVLKDGEMEKLQKLLKYQKEGRGEWRFYPLWKKILYVILTPFIMLWLGIGWCIMKAGRGIYMFGDMITGWRWNEGNWTEDV